MKLSTVTALLFATAGSAIDISIYLKKGCHGNHATCKNISKDNCCFAASAIGHIGSAHFSHMKKKDRGGILASTGNKICGSLTGLREGSGCVNGKGGSKSAGAVWEPPASEANGSAEGLDNECAGAVFADTAVIDGHSFHINHHVPEADSAALYALMVESIEYKDIPKHLKQWEVGV